MLVPASTALVYYIVFQFVMKVQIPNYILFILSGLLPWSFFSGAIIQGMESVVANAGLLNKVPIPVYVFPYTETLTAIINFAFSIPIILGISFLTQAPITLALFETIPLIMCLFIQAYALALTLSLLFVYLRDLRHVLTITMQIWFYLTPIIYEPNMIPERYQPLLALNPVGFIFHGLHENIVYGRFIEVSQWYSVFSWTTLMFALAVFITRRFYGKVAESL